MKDKSKYYDAGGIETIDIIKAKLTPEQYLGYCLGNVIKYVSRFNFKSRRIEGKKRDLEKAMAYIHWALLYIDNEKIKKEN